MKITQEILDNGKWLKNNLFRYKNKSYRRENCKQCGEECFTLKEKGIGVCCDRKCFYEYKKELEISEETRKRLGESKKGNTYGFKKGQVSPNKGKQPSPEMLKILEKTQFKKGVPSWNACPYNSKGIPKYDLYASKLQPYEECRRNGEDPNILEVRCTYCGKWFIPNKWQVQRRVGGINRNDTSRFYCSDGCKKECPIFGKQTRYRGQDGFNSREVQPELRQLVFIRDDYTCQKCGIVGGSLHCHHITGVEVNPIESADVDNCITFCKSCHKEAHKEMGCRYIDLRGCIEDNQTTVVNI